jgi:hypothetical protein
MQKKYSFPDHVIKSSQMRAKLRLRNETYIHRTHTTHTHNTHTHTHTHTHCRSPKPLPEFFFVVDWMVLQAYKQKFELHTVVGCCCIQKFVVYAFVTHLHLFKLTNSFELVWIFFFFCCMTACARM